MGENNSAEKKEKIVWIVSGNHPRLGYFEIKCKMKSEANK